MSNRKVELVISYIATALKSVFLRCIFIRQNKSDVPDLN